MPKFGHITYPDKINEILSDHKLMRVFNQYIGGLRRGDIQRICQFVQTPPDPTGMWKFLNPNSGPDLLKKLKATDWQRVNTLRATIDETGAAEDKKERVLQNWRGWADIRKNALDHWTAEINTRWVPKFYESKAFQKHHHTANASGSLQGVQHAAAAIKLIKVDEKAAKALGYTNPKDKKLQLALGAVAKSAALKLDKPGKEAFAAVKDIEKLDKYKNYEDLVKAMKQKKVFV